MIFSRFGLPVEIIGAVTVEFVTDDPPQIWVACRVFDNEGYDREYAIWDLRADGGISEIMAAIDRSENGLRYQTDENPPD